MDRNSEICYLLYIYAKPEKTDLSANKIEALLREIEDLLDDEA